MQKSRIRKSTRVRPDSAHPPRVLARVARRFGTADSPRRRALLDEHRELFATVLETILQDFRLCFERQANAEIDESRIVATLSDEAFQDLIAGIYQQDLLIATLGRLRKANQLIRDSMLDELHKRVAADRNLPATARRGGFDLHLARGLVLTTEADSSDAAEQLLDTLQGMTDWPAERLVGVARGEPIRELEELARRIEDAPQLASGIARLILAGREETRDTLKRIPEDRRLARAVAEQRDFDPCLVRYALLCLRRMVRCEEASRQGELFE